MSGPRHFLFTIAGALLLTLIFRSVASHVMRVVTRYIGALRIRRVLRARSADVLHDFILPGAYGGLVKIDHAILTAGGILCIQTKHYNGIVFGEPDEPQWTNVDGPLRRRFLNPLIQNEGRTRALQAVVPEVPVDNVVVFTGNVEFPTPPPEKHDSRRAARQLHRQACIRPEQSQGLGCGMAVRKVGGADR